MWFFKSVLKQPVKILQIIVNQTKRDSSKIIHSRWEINEIIKLDDIPRLVIETGEISLKRMFLKAVNELK